MLEKIDLRESINWKYLILKFLNNREISTKNSGDWKKLLKYKKEIKAYFGVINYDLKIHEADGFAYLEELEEDGENIDTLSKKQKMSFLVSLFLVLLREFIYKKEAEDFLNFSWLISYVELKDLVFSYLQEKFKNDDKKIEREYRTTIEKLKKMGILSDFGENFKINKILKIKMSSSKMEEFLENLKK
ncbi:MAG: DUF4194 domain-containing protein [Candidatus Gracilibacteria bacterium]|nr:DUF4194 domain-containing protein [Candidatus Gracilibacteria bacterium]